MAPSCVVEAGDCPVVSPSDLAAIPSRPIALYCAVIGMLMVPMAPSWLSPTEVVEQLLAASAKRPSDSEHALIGTSAFRSGDFWFVVLVPLSAFWPGSRVLPISLASNVMGMDNDSGSAVRADSGLPGVVDDLAAGVDVVVGAGTGAGVGAGVVAAFGTVAFGTVVVVVAFGAVVVVTESFDVVDDGMTLVVAAPAGPRPTSTLAAASTRPPVSTAIEERGFRLKVLLHSVYGLHRPALSPRLWVYIPTGGNSETAVVSRSKSKEPR